MFVKVVVQSSALPEITERIAGLRSGDREVKKMADNFSTVVQAMAPRDTGWMVTTASEVVSFGGPGRSRYGVGPFEKLGAPRKKAPKGTIAKFLEDYPEYAHRKGLTKSGKQRVRRRRREFPSAWNFLSGNAKRKLRDLRRAGMYGMDGPSPRYWQSVQEMRVPGRDGVMSGSDFLSSAYAAAYMLSVLLEKNVFGR